MKKSVLIFLVLFSFNAHSTEKDYSFTYLDLSVNYNDDVSYEAGATSGDLNLDGIDDILDIILLVNNIINN